MAWISSAGHRCTSFKDWLKALGPGAGGGEWKGWRCGHPQCHKGCILGCQKPLLILPEQLIPFFCGSEFAWVNDGLFLALRDGRGEVLIEVYLGYLPLRECSG